MSVAKNKRLFTHFRLAYKLRMSGDVPSLLHMPSNRVALMSTGIKLLSILLESFFHFLFRTFSVCY